MSADSPQIKAMKEEIQRIKKAMADDEERLKNATTTNDRQRLEKWIRIYEERLANEEKKLTEAVQGRSAKPGTAPQPASSGASAVKSSYGQEVRSWKVTDVKKGCLKGNLVDFSILDHPTVVQVLGPDKLIARLSWQNIDPDSVIRDYSKTFWIEGVDTSGLTTGEQFSEGQGRLALREGGQPIGGRNSEAFLVLGTKTYQDVGGGTTTLWRLVHDKRIDEELARREAEERKAAAQKAQAAEEEADRHWKEKQRRALEAHNAAEVQSRISLLTLSKRILKDAETSQPDEATRLRKMAADRLQRLVNDYPNTAEAKEAAELLKGPDKKP
jgi:hypothetical protein